MARIVFADDGISFDGRTPDSAPIGGAETAFISLAEAFAARGHEVFVHNNCAERLTHKNVTWVPLDTGRADYGLPVTADLYIANRGDRMIPLLPRARRRVFWIHNPANYILKWRYLSKIWRWKPVIVFSSAYHAASYPAWAPAGGRMIIPYGIDDLFRLAEPCQTPPPPRAVFTSNPLRSLDWLLDLWAERINPQAPEAELHVYSGPATYGAVGDAKAARMTPILDKARGLADKGVVLRAPVPRQDLIKELKAARVLLYRGDSGETYCLAVGEAQAIGVPAVVQAIGCVGERIVDGETGFVAADDAAFADDALALLRDDDLWTRQHEAALLRQRNWSWMKAAEKFEEIFS